MSRKVHDFFDSLLIIINDYIPNNPIKKDGLAWKAKTNIEITNNMHPSTLDNFRPLLISNTINSIVKNNSINENEVSCIKWASHEQFQDDNKQTGVSVIGVIVALIQMIHSVLNIFDQTKFQIHISNFFFKIAVIVVANSGKLVHAAMIVAQMARCDIHNISAI